MAMDRELALVIGAGLIGLLGAVVGGTVPTVL